MKAQGFAVFQTALGHCAVTWSGQGIVGVQLPEADERQTRARMRPRFPGAQEATAPPEVREAIDSIVALLSGRARDLSAVRLDMEGTPPFDRSVYAIARGIAPGSTLTYGQIAARLDDPGLARAVGQALGRNPFAIVVPCHRVLAAGGRVGGFSASGGPAMKRRLLSIEGARRGNEPELFDE